MEIITVAKTALYWSKTNRHTLSCFVAALAMTLTAFVFSRSRQPPEDSRWFGLVAERDLAVGEVLQSESLSIRTSRPLTGVLSEQDLGQVLGRRLTTFIAKGEWIRESDLASLQSASLESGQLAYRLAMRSPLKLKPGDRIDLLFLPHGGRKVPELLLDWVRVVEATPIGAPPVVALSVEEIQWVELAQQRGSLRAALRPPGKEKPTLMRKPRFGDGKKKVEIWEELRP